MFDSLLRGGRFDCHGLIDAEGDRRYSLLLLFRCCNQRLLIKLLSSIADADDHTADRFTAVVAVVLADAAKAADVEL